MATIQPYKGSSGFSPQIELTGYRAFKLFGKFRIFGWAPYLSGSVITFRVSLRDKSEESIPYEWRLSREGRDRPYWVEGKGDNEDPRRGQIERGKRDEIIDIGFLFYGGKHSFQMRWKDEISAGDRFQDVVYFSVEDHDAYIIRWMQVVLSGIIGAIIGAVIALAAK